MPAANGSIESQLHYGLSVTKQPFALKVNTAVTATAQQE
jgi:hypothetical protein